MIVYDHFFCCLINLFVKEGNQHQDSCCVACIIKMPKTLYSESSWFPKQIEEAQQIIYTLDGENWLRYQIPDEEIRGKK